MARRRQCSECLGYGHNKRTCPDRPEWRKERDAQSHARRRCSYCQGVGHNRRKCAMIDKDIEVYRILTGALRKCRVERIHELDLGIGTVFTKDGWVRPKGAGSYEKKTMAWMITGIDWNSLHLAERNPLRFYRIKALGNWGMSGQQFVSFGLFDRKKLKDGTAHPAGAKQALAQIPVGYYKAEDITKKRFAPADVDKQDLARKHWLGTDYDPTPEVLWAHRKLGRPLTPQNQAILAKYEQDPKLYGRWARYFLM